LTTHPIYRRGKRKNRAILLLHIWVFVACSKVTFIFTLNVARIFSPVGMFCTVLYMNIKFLKV
jgi:hypothetical protein